MILEHRNKVVVAHRRLFAQEAQRFFVRSLGVRGRHGQVGGVLLRD